MRLVDLIYGKREPEKDNITQEDIRRLQLLLLEIVLEFDRICDKYGLRYWIDSGTLLGAVRHKGFIPWDDDLDVAMPIEDYFRFVEIANEELPDHMFFQTWVTERSWKKYYGKIRSSKGAYFEKTELAKIMQGRKLKHNTGVYIDIFPCITVREDEKRRLETHFKVADRIRKIINVGYLIEPLFRFVDSRLHRGWEGEDLYVARSVRFPELEFFIPLEAMLPIKEYEFEGYKLKGPADYHTVLTIMYGDYMTLPPPEDRWFHAYKLEIYEDSSLNADRR